MSADFGLRTLGSSCCLALAVGWGRSGYGPTAGLATRYVSLTVPGLCGVYLAWVALGSPAGRVVQMALFALVCALFLPNLQLTAERKSDYTRKMDAFGKDLAAGMPPDALAERHLDWLFPFFDTRGGTHEAPTPEARAASRDFVAHRIRSLHRAGIGPFRHLKEDEPALSPVPLPVEPAAVDRGPGGGKQTGQGPAVLTYTLGKPQRVSAIRLTITYEDTATPIKFKASWMNSTREDSFSEVERSYSYQVSPTSADVTVTVWVNDTIDAFRISPDSKPRAFKVSKVELLMPPA